MTKENQHLVLIDGYGFVFRAFHAFPPLRREDGTPVGAIFGFTSMLSKVLLEFTCSHLAVVLDSGGKTFRHDIFPEYKSHRPPAPEDLIPQFPLVRKAVSSLNIDILEQKGYEADDLIATFAKDASNKGMKVTVISSDKDLMQLIDDNISLYDPIKSKYIKATQVEDKFSVRPDQIIDILALIGDSADYIPGVPGIGPKTASELLNKYNSLDGIYQSMDEIPSSKRKQSLIDNKELAYLSQKLVVLEDQVPTENSLDDLRIKISHVDQFKDFLHEQNFNSLYSRADKICQNFNHQNIEYHDPILSAKIIELKTGEDLKSWLERKTSSSGQLSLILEAGFLCISCDPSEIVICSIAGSLNSGLFQSNNGFSIKELSNILIPFINDSSINKILHDVKTFYHIIAEYVVVEEVAWQTSDDIQLISYILNNGVHGHDLKTLVQHYSSLGDDLELKQWLGYSALFLLQLYSKLKLQLVKEKLLILYERIEKPLSYVLYKMELEGILVDQLKLKEISEDFSKRCLKLEKEIYEIAGMEFNLGSPKQMAEVLFNKLDLLSDEKKAKNKKFSTNVEVLEELSHQGHKIADLILHWRHLSKLNNTYAKSLGKNADSEGRIHTSFQMTSTSTGRLSSSNPNLQNIPIRSDDGTKIRSAFIAKPGYQLISADYSQVELRLLAHMAEIASLQDAFKNHQDIHAITASEVFKIPLSEVTSDLRRQAKAINFGIIYGQSAFGLAKQLSISRSDANKYIESYFEHYPGIKQYMERTKEFARENGFVETLQGRKCYTRTINDSNSAIRNFAERAAINAPLQGTAADIIKKAMIQLNKEIEKRNLPAKILLQIHDELILEVKEESVEVLSKLTKQIMESAITLSIPLDVNIDHGKNWAEI
ncbi:MAG: DNA polymerase I [Rickettsiales bacterium]|jgi:DNA polymerase-1|nr:DNA polymerase I [Rickettsiales bacterium]